MLNNAKTKFLGFLAMALLMVTSLGMVSCKDDTDEQAEADEKIILDYLAANNLEATRHSSGLYYKIIAPGSGSSPEAFSIVGVRYKGWLVDGTVFEQTEGTSVASYTLGGLIDGWQIGIGMLKPGGKISLYIPSKLGYGSKASGDIPANSVLVFDVELVSFF